MRCSDRVRRAVIKESRYWKSIYDTFLEKGCRCVRRILGVSFIVLLFGSCCTGVIFAIVTARNVPSVTHILGGDSAVGEAATVLRDIQVQDHLPSRRYHRDVFEYQKYDPDGNGCTTREDILLRDLKDTHKKPGNACIILSGVLQDPYTGKKLSFQRGAQTSREVQIDHVVALKNAWESGAYAWDPHKLREFGNDPYNLLAVEGKANEDKGSQSAATWLPQNKGFACPYVARQIGVKKKYGLTVTRKEKRAMLKVLHACPMQKVPRA